MRHTGLMGGTFDPIHLGHLFIAQSALDELMLDRVIFLPDGDPPHKRPYAAAEQRLHMVELACEDRPAFEVSDMELRRPGPTYTVDTLRLIKAERPDEELVYLIGSDTLFLFHSWKTAHEVARLCRIAVVLRPGDERGPVARQQEALRQSHGLDSILLSHPGLPISSSLVRKAVAQGSDLSHLLPEKVADYVREQTLYLPCGM